MKHNTKVALGALALLGTVTALSAPTLLAARPAHAAGLQLSARRHCDNARLDFTLANRTGHTIQYLYVSPSTRSNWGTDRLGDDVIPSGSRYRVDFFTSHDDEDTWDIKAVLVGGHACTKMHVDLSRVNTLTILRSGSHYRYAVS